jgi:type I restriction enzyme, S subunit
MEMKNGYKDTEIGLIPEEWEAVSLSDRFHIATGGTPPTSDKLNYGDRFLFVSPADLGENKFVRDTQKKLSEKGFRLSRKFPPGSTLFTCIGSTIGKTGLASETLTSNQQINAVFPNDWDDSEFVYYSIDHISPKVKALAGEQAVPIVNKRSFGQTKIPIPIKKEEQRAIATALSDVDALLDGLDRLIAKKRDIKQAAMQQLLTGKTRLPGFEGEWALKRLEEICSMKSGEGITSADIMFPCYGGNGLRGYTARYTHHGCYALIGRQGALCGNVVKADGRFFASEHAVVVTPLRGTNVNWLAVVLVRMNLNQYSESSAQPGLSVSKLLVMSLAVPSFPEQTAIATILSDMDAEIEALQQRRVKTRDLKKAMMQELLTGRTRLV